MIKSFLCTIFFLIHLDHLWITLLGIFSINKNFYILLFLITFMDLKIIQKFLQNLIVGLIIKVRMV